MIACFLTGLLTVQQFLAPPALVARVGQPPPTLPFAGLLVDVSTDGKRVYTVVYDRQDVPAVCGWDANTGRELTRYPLVGRGEQIAWHAGGYQHLGLGPEGLRVGVRPNPDKDWSHFLCVVNPDTGKTLQSGRTWPYPQQPEDFRKFARPEISSSPDAKWFLRRDNTCTLYAAATGEAVKIDPPDPLRPHGTEFGCDGRLFVTSAVNGTVRVYDLPSGKLRCEIANPATDQFAAVCTPDGRGVVVWVQRKDGWALEFVDLSDKARRTVLDKQPVTGRVIFAPDGKLFARVAQAGEWPEEVSVGDWEVREWGTGALRARVPAGRYPPRAVFSTDNKTLYVQAGERWSEFRRVIPWDIATDKPRFATPEPLGPVERFRFTADGKLIGLAGGYVHSWDPLTGKSLGQVRLPTGIDRRRGAVFGPTDQHLAFAEAGDALVSWNFRTGGEHRTKPELRTTKDHSAGVWFLPDGTQFAEYADGVLIVRNRADGRELWRGALPVQYRPSHFPLGLHPIAIDPKGRLAMSGVEEFPSPRGLRAPPPTPVIVVSPGDSAKDAAVFELDQSVGALEFSPGGRFLAISGGRYDWRQVKEPDTRRVLTIWDAVYKRRVGTFPLPDVGYVIAARFSPDGRSLALAHQPLGVVVVETATWQVRASFPAITRELGGWHRPTCDWDALAWSPDSRTLAVAAPDGGLSVWDITKPSRPVEIDGPVLERAWTDLASDAKAGYAATRTFLAAGDRGVVFLKAKIAAAPAPDAKHLAALVTDLGSDDFRTREDATRELNKLGRCAGPALRAALRTTKSPEAADRMKDLVRALDHTKLAPDDCRVVRAVEATEWIGTPEALKLLERWATGAEGAFLTTEARGSFDRRKR